MCSLFVVHVYLILWTCATFTNINCHTVYKNGLEWVKWHVYKYLYNDADNTICHNSPSLHVVTKYNHTFCGNTIMCINLVAGGVFYARQSFGPKLFYRCGHTQSTLWFLWVNWCWTGTHRITLQRLSSWHSVLHIWCQE